MKKRVEARLNLISRKHKALKLPCMLFLALFLIVYYPIYFLFSNRRKISGAILVSLIFVCFSSFSFAGAEPNTEEKEEKNAVYVVTDEGDFEVEEIDWDLVEDEGKENIITNDFQADYEARIYDEKKGYVKALYNDDWSLILINKDHPIPSNYEFELSTIKGNVKSDVRVVPYVMEMIKAAKQQGVTLYICSPFRSDEKQEVLFKKKQRYYIRQGYSEHEAYNLASQTIAIPGTSEHQVGLAFDFISDEYKYLDAGFADSSAGRWLKKHGAEYGFILRYPEGKEDITGIEFEPWHYRFVGKAAAKEIMDSGLTLEEYLKKIGAVE